MLEIKWSVWLAKFSYSLNAKESQFLQIKRNVPAFFVPCSSSFILKLISLFKLCIFPFKEMFFRLCWGMEWERQIDERASCELNSIPHIMHFLGLNIGDCLMKSLKSFLSLFFSDSSIFIESAFRERLYSCKLISVTISIMICRIYESKSSRTVSDGNIFDMCWYLLRLLEACDCPSWGVFHPWWRLLTIDKSYDWICFVMLSIACLEVKDVVPWVSALILCVSIRIAFMMKRTQGMLSSKEKSIQVIDANLGCLWGGYGSSLLGLQ